MSQTVSCSKRRWVTGALGFENDFIAGVMLESRLDACSGRYTDSNSRAARAESSHCMPRDPTSPKRQLPCPCSLSSDNRAWHSIALRGSSIRDQIQMARTCSSFTGGLALESQTKLQVQCGRREKESASLRGHESMRTKRRWFDCCMLVFHLQLAENAWPMSRHSMCFQKSAIRLIVKLL